jgi:hypothetical protein
MVAMDSLILAMSVIASVLALVAAIGAWRPSASDQAPTDKRVEELITALKGGLMADLGRVRASVEAGLREASETTRQTQEELHNQTALISEHLHQELQHQFVLLCGRVEQLIETRFGQLVTGVDRRFDKALEDQRTALAEQLDHLRDLRRAYEMHLVNLRKDVAQQGSQNNHAILALGARLESELEQLEIRIAAMTGTNRPAPVRVASHH